MNFIAGEWKAKPTRLTPPPSGRERGGSTGQLQVMTISLNTMTRSGSVVMNRTRYCRYWALGLEMVPPLVTVDQPDHVPSGAAVLPVRTSTIMLVPAGVIAVQFTV